VLRDRDTANEKDGQMWDLTKSVSLNPETEGYDGGPHDQIYVNDLEWNKVRKQECLAPESPYETHNCRSGSAEHGCAYRAAFEKNIPVAKHALGQTATRMACVKVCI